MVPVVPKDKLSGHNPLGDRSRIGGYHLQGRVLRFSTRPVVRQQLCPESSEEALLHFDQKKLPKDFVRQARPLPQMMPVSITFGTKLTLHSAGPTGLGEHIHRRRHRCVC